MTYRRHPELSKLIEQLDTAGLPEQTHLPAVPDPRRSTIFRKTPAMPPEATVIRTYLEWLAQVPCKTDEPPFKHRTCTRCIGVT